ncbi:MAG: hypothetical protein ACRCVJ_11795 [Clostridium sp.]|uniref:hypothetical protein n=1 Tax=Clostridium sp. TaxID=1506 RepID=UPI003F3F54CE
MIKCKLKCDKLYGGIDGWQDCDCIDDKLLINIVDKYKHNNVLEVTKEVVDFYNITRQINVSKNSFKTAGVLIKHLRRVIKENEFNKRG